MPNPADYNYADFLLPATLEMDAEAFAQFRKMSKRARSHHSGRTYGEGMQMLKCDEQSRHAKHGKWVFAEQSGKKHGTKTVVSSWRNPDPAPNEQGNDDILAMRPLPKFATGQSVLQWWASWMKDAVKMPRSFSGKSGRPKWYSGEIVAVKEYRSGHRYAGVWHGPCWLYYAN
jgi:hypothetical protein